MADGAGIFLNALTQSGIRTYDQTVRSKAAIERLKAAIEEQAFAEEMRRAGMELDKAQFRESQRQNAYNRYMDQMSMLQAERESLENEKKRMENALMDIRLEKYKQGEISKRERFRQGAIAARSGLKAEPKAEQGEEKGLSLIDQKRQMDLEKKRIDLEVQKQTGYPSLGALNKVLMEEKNLPPLTGEEVLSGKGLPRLGKLPTTKKSLFGSEVAGEDTIGFKYPEESRSVPPPQPAEQGVEVQAGEEQRGEFKTKEELIQWLEENGYNQATIDLYLRRWDVLEGK